MDIDHAVASIEKKLFLCHYNLQQCGQMYFVTYTNVTTTVRSMCVSGKKGLYDRKQLH